MPDIELYIRIIVRHLVIANLYLILLALLGLELDTTLGSAPDTPFSTPPNALVMKAGGYTFMDYVKVGLPLQIIIGVVMTFVLPLLFPY